MRESVEGATPSCAATSSSLNPLDSRSLRSSVPSRRLRTVGPVVIADTPSSADAVTFRRCNYGLRPRPRRPIASVAPDMQHPTAKIPEAKSQTGFHLQNLSDALAQGGLATALW